MSDPQYHPWDDPSTDDERIVADAFAAFREAQRATAVPPPLDTVYAAVTAQRRRRRYLVGLAAAAALVVATGSAALLTGLGRPTPAPVADRPPAPSQSPSASPSGSTAPSPEPDKPASPSAPPPKKTIRDINLRNVTVTVDSLGSCAGGTLSFSGGRASGPDGCAWKIADGDERYADLDGDGGEEAVTTIAAGPPNTEYLGAVIAFRYDAGKLRTMSYVYVADHSSQRITGITVSDGGITIGIADSSWDPEQSQWQQRTFRWGGGGFTQIGGPTAFPSPDPAPSSPEPSGSPAAE